MPELKGVASLTVALALLSAVACSHANDDQGGSGSRTNIDLAVTNFAAIPNATDPEDPLTLTGTIQNLGTEMANPLAGDFFLVYFNLSQDATLEQTEQGFTQLRVDVPIPPGGSLPFTVSAPFGNGDTLSRFGNFCTSIGCVPPQAGVIGVKLDGAEGIRELEEGNNFQFVTNQVVGTRVAATLSTCTFGSPSSPGCTLIVSDQHLSVTLRRPCSTCQATEVVLPNELRRIVSVNLQLRGCTDPVCGWGVTITAETQKPGQLASKLQIPLTCHAFSANGPDAACPYQIEIRDPDY